MAGQREPVGEALDVERLARAIGPTVGAWFEAGYENGRLDPVMLAEKIAPIVIAEYAALRAAANPERGDGK